MDSLRLVRKNQFKTSSIAVERFKLVDHMPSELITSSIGICGYAMKALLSLA